MGASVVLLISFALIIFLASDRDFTANEVDFGAATWFLPIVCGAYYFARGLLVTTLYVHARSLADIGFATKLSLYMGFFGQVAAFVATAVTFVLVIGLHVFE